MKMVLCEIKKLLGSAAFVFIFSAVAVLNIYLCVTAKPVEISDEQYRAHYAEMSGNSAADAAKIISEKIAHIYDEGVSYDAVLMKNFLLSEQEQAQNIAGYSDCLDDIKATAQRLSSTSIFAKRDSFSYKNIILTPAAYEAVKSVVPEYSPSEGILLAADNSACDAMVLFVALAAAATLFIKERELGIIALIKPLRHGRAQLCVAKLTAMLLCSLLCGAVIYSSAFLGEYSLRRRRTISPDSVYKRVYRVQS